MDSDNPVQVISKAIEDLSKITAKIAELPNVCYEATESGVAIAKEEMQKRGIPTDGELGDSVKAYMSSADTATLEADGGFATFVEFGTGIVGQKQPHAEAEKRSVAYDRNGHGEAGWVYEKNGKYYRTKGYRSRPFWYATGKKLKTKSKQMIFSKLGIKGK